MRMEFEVSSFLKRPKHLISVLSSLRAVGQWSPCHRQDIEDVVCSTPSSALNYCRYVVGAYGVSRDGERVFLKNPGIGIRYLRMVNRDRFVDDDTQKRFWRKVTKNSDLALQWARTFMRRLPSEDDEMVFADNPHNANQYARHVVRGPLSEKVHERILLKSFESKCEFQKRYLKEYLSWAKQCMEKV